MVVPPIACDRTTIRAWSHHQSFLIVCQAVARSVVRPVTSCSDWLHDQTVMLHTISICNRSPRLVVRASVRLLCQGEWTRNSRFLAPNLRGAIAPSRFGCDESTCFASIRRLKMHSDMQLVILFLQLIQMHMITSEVGPETSINSCLSVCQHVYSKSYERIWTIVYLW